MPHKDPTQRKAYDAAYRLAHKETRNAYSRAYNAAHRARHRQLKRESRLRHREKHNAKSRAYYLAHKEETNKKHAQWYKEHREEQKAYHAAYHAAHHEEKAKYRATYYSQHRDIYYEARDRRRARKASSPHCLKREQWEAIKAAYGHHCAYCGAKETKKRPLTQDHVVPLSKGGGTIPENIVPACADCNAGKKTGPPVSLPPKRLMI